MSQKSLTVFTTLLDSLMTLQNASLGQYKKPKHNPFSNTHSFYQSECAEKCKKKNTSGEIES